MNTLDFQVPIIGIEFDYVELLIYQYPTVKLPKQAEVSMELVLEEEKRIPANTATGTLGKATAVLEIVASFPHPPRFTEILKHSDQPRGTLHRQITNLVEEGLLNQRKDMSYELGYKLLMFASKAWAGNEFRTIAEPHLIRLQQHTGETVHLGVLRKTQVIYLDKVEGQQTVRMYSQIGNAAAAYCTGVGKAAMAALDDMRLDACIRSIEFFPYTENTITDGESLRREINRIRESGIAFDREEHELGIQCVAAPIFTQDHAFAAGVSVTGPAFRVPMEKLEAWADDVGDCARRIMDDMNTRLGPRM